MSEPPPFWYERALETPSTAGDLVVAGASIHYVAWGEVGNPGIVLVHGSNAHLEWWRFVAPFLADQFRVVALDSSGNGDSDWRERYDREVLAEEVWAAANAAQLGPRPIVVGHSFGGFVALEVGHQYGDRLTGIVMMDYTVGAPDNYAEWGMRVAREGVEPGRRLRVYPDKETALGRFRLLPDQPGVHPLVLAHMAEHGLKEVDGGWTWKFDPGLFDYLEMGVDQIQKFAGLTCRCSVVLGEDSTDGGALFGDHMLEITRGKLPVFKIPGTYHHLMFDQPLAVAMVIKAISLEWLREEGTAELTAALRSVAS